MPLDLIAIEDRPVPQVLKQQATAVAFPLSAEDKAFIEAFKIKAKTIGGVGLAAPQVGISKQIIAFVIDEDAKAIRNNAHEVVPLTIWLNPEYRPFEGSALANDWEGCFSVREVYGKVPRYEKIHYSAYNEAGEKISGVLEGFTARVVQHEIDHVNGLLIIDRFKPDSLFGNPKEMVPLRMKELSAQQKAVFDKITARQKAAAAEEPVKNKP